MAGFVNQQFGTARGAVRLGLSYVEVAGGMAQQRKPNPANITRLVFVCHGNICRSAFAQGVATQLGYANVGFGLSTGADAPAYPLVVEKGAAMGYDLSAHRTVKVEDFEPQAGDFLLGMEARHMRKLAANEKLAEVPRALLGTYAKLPVPHLHDPYKLDPDYMDTCLARIEDAVTRLCAQFPNAKQG